MSVYSDMKCAIDEEEYRYLESLARQEAREENEEPWESWEDEEEDEDEE